MARAILGLNSSEEAPPTPCGQALAVWNGQAGACRRRPRARARVSLFRRTAGLHSVRTFEYTALRLADPHLSRTSPRLRAPNGARFLGMADTFGGDDDDDTGIDWSAAFDACPAATLATAGTASTASAATTPAADNESGDPPAHPRLSHRPGFGGPPPALPRLTPRHRRLLEFGRRTRGQGTASGRAVGRVALRASWWRRHSRCAASNGAGESTPRHLSRSTCLALPHSPQ